MRSERPHATTYATDPRSKVLLVEASSGDAHVLSSYRAFDATSAASARERGRGSGPKSREVGALLHLATKASSPSTSIAASIRKGGSIFDLHALRVAGRRASLKAPSEFESPGARC